MSDSLAAEPGPGTHADQVRIVHLQVEWPGTPPLARHQIVITPRGKDVDLDWMVREIEAIQFHTSYVLTQQRNRISWGASASTVEFVIETMETFGAIGGTLLVEHTWEALIKKLKAMGYDIRHGPIEALTDSDAIGRGVQLITSEFGMSADSLTPKSVSHDVEAHTVTVAALGRDDATYTVTFRARGDLTTLVSRSRELPRP